MAQIIGFSIRITHDPAMDLGNPLGRLTGRARSILLSRRLSTWLLAVWALGLGLRAILPPTFWPSFVGDGGLALVTLYLSVGVVVCSLQRIRETRTVGHGSIGPVPIDPIRIELRPEGDRGRLPGIERSLRREGWRVRSVGTGELTGAKGRTGFWGSILFHASVLGMIGGGAYGALVGKTAEIVLTEGETQRIAVGEAAEGVRTLTLRRAEATYLVPNKPVSFTALVDLGDERREGEPRRVGVNESLLLPGGVRLLLTQFGYSPRLRVEDPRGGILQDAFVALKGMGEGTRDGFRVASEGTEYEAEFFPDLVVGSDGIPRSRGPETNAPALRLRLVGAAGGRGEILPLGGRVVLGGLTLRFTDLRPWVAFQLVRGRMGIALGAAFLALVGLGIRFLDPERHLRLRLEPSGGGGGCLLWGRSRAFPHLFRGELERLALRIAADEGLP